MESSSHDTVKQIRRYQHCIQQINPVESDPDRVLHCIRKLSKLPIRLAELEKTGVGITVNSFRKLDGRIAEEATLLVAKWKSIVKKQVDEETASEHKSDLDDQDHSDNNDLPIDYPVDRTVQRPAFEYDETLSKKGKDGDVKKSTLESTSHKNKVHLITIKKEECPDRKRKHSSEDKERGSRTEKQKKNDQNSISIDKNRQVVKQESPNDLVGNDANFVRESTKDIKKRNRENDRKSHKKDHEKRHHKSSIKHKEEKFHRESKHHREDKHRSHHDRKHDSDVKSCSHKHKRDKKSRTQIKEDNDARKPDKHRKSNRESSETEIKTQESTSREVNRFKNDEMAGDNFGAALLGIPLTTPPRKKSSSSKSSTHQESPTSFSSPKSNNSVDFLSCNIKLEPLSKELDISDVSYSSKNDYSDESSKLLKFSGNKLDEIISPTYYSPREKITKSKALSEEDMFSSMVLMKNRRTKVYHGGKVSSKFPTLFELCVRILQDNFDALEYTGGVPYDVLKPILEKVTVEQLYTFENYNPYLIGETDELWEHHAKKHFRKAERQEYETWRDLYLRCVEEREEKLQSLTENITQSMANSAPVRKTKLAYLDTVVKPPRGVARQQAKHGTSNIMVKKSKDPQPSPSAVQSVKERLSKEASSPTAIQIPTKIVKKKAPLMQKSLQLLKGLKR